MNESILIICFYKGEFPNYAEYFFESCKDNPCINFLILNDRLKEEGKVRNIEFRKFGLADFNQLASKELGQNINLDRGFKVCDLRPAYGVIFNKDIQDYEYWGYCDMDIILGQCNHFLKYLGQYDVFSTKLNWNSGSFSIFRNSKKINQLFMSNDDWKTIFSNNAYFGFDECGLRWDNPDDRNAGHGYSSIYDLLLLEENRDIRTSYNDFVVEWPIDFKSLKRKDGIWLNNMTGNEFMYLHLLLQKNNWRFFIPEFKELNLFVSELGISNVSQKVSFQYLFWLSSRMLAVAPKAIKALLDRGILGSIRHFFVRFKAHG